MKANRRSWWVPDWQSELASRGYSPDINEPGNSNGLFDREQTSDSRGLQGTANGLYSAMLAEDSYRPLTFRVCRCSSGPTTLPLKSSWFMRRNAIMWISLKSWSTTFRVRDLGTERSMCWLTSPVFSLMSYSQLGWKGVEREMEEV